jgi:spore maturation protein CgeB
MPGVFSDGLPRLARLLAGWLGSNVNARGETLIIPGRDAARVFAKVFSAPHYGSLVPAARFGRGGALAHYLRSGRRNGLAPSPLIDPDFIRATYRGLRGRTDPVDFFMLYAARHVLSPSPYFDTAFYLDRNPDVRQAGINPLVHYLQHGEAEGREPNRYFSPSYYRRFAGTLPEGISALEHYASVGGFAGLDPSERFSSAAYLDALPDLRGTAINPLCHFLGQGTAARASGTAAARVPGGMAIETLAIAEASTPKLARNGACPVATRLMGSPLVSMIVISRGDDEALDSLLRSFLRTRRHKAVDVLVVDLAEADRSADILYRWSEHLPLGVLSLEPGETTAAAANLAARAARGDLLFFVDPAVVFAEDVIVPMAAALQDDSVGVVGVKRIVRGGAKANDRGTALIGTRLGWCTRSRLLRPQPVSPGPVDAYLAETPARFPAVSGDALMCRRADFLALGGFDEGYATTGHDADFCCRMAEDLGKIAVNLNDRSVQVAAAAASAASGEDDRRFHERWAGPLRRALRLGAIEGDGSETGRRLRVAFAVSSADPLKGAGDLYTAQGLGDALAQAHGWDVCYLPEPGWYDARGLDVIVAMRHDFDPAKLRHLEPNAILVAWMRNWFDRWAEHPGIEAFDLHFAASRPGARHLAERAGIAADLLPIAVAPDLFCRGVPIGRFAADYVFTGHSWPSATNREIEAFDPASLPYRFRVYGLGWETHPRFAAHHGGAVDYRDLPKVYASAPVTIDDAVSAATKPWGSLNSRVFEALAAGSLVLTNNRDGSEDLFGGRLPVWSDAEDLGRQVARFLGDPDACRMLADELRDEVLARHTYAHRAETLQRALVRAAGGLRIAIKCPAPKRSEAESWGDYHFALGLKRALVARGCNVRVDLLPDWSATRTIADDVVIALRGLTAYTPVPGQINLVWMISHPDKVADAELEAYDHVFVASRNHAATLADRLSVPVSTLLQCSDPARFFPPAEADRVASKVLFVGNSRGVERPALRDALALGLDLSVHGRDWSGRVPERALKGTFIPNHELNRHYAGATIVLNDQWPDMAEKGFVSNRIFDAALSGAFVISEAFAGSDLFGDALVTYEGRDGLAAAVARWTPDPNGRARMADRLRAIVAARHTFDHRAADILAVVDRLMVKADVAIGFGATGRAERVA